ncbi:MAG TPA: ATP-binding protein [Haliangiales bacterium]|nr:ATP-binding protein [Haliangiales bacterium]
MNAVLVCAVAVVGFAFAAVVYRAAPRRFDNRVFAALGFMNAVMAAYATVLVLTGYRMSEPFPLRTCGTLVVPIAVLSVEFGYSFPLNRPLRGRLRALLWGYAAACAALYFHPATYPWFGNVISWAFFLPAFLVMMICLARNVRGLQGERGAGWLVVAALGVRWLLGLFTFNVARYVSSSVFDAAVTFEMSAGSLICYAVIGYAFLKSQLFSVRGVAADMVVFTGLVLSILFLAAGAVEVVLTLGAGAVVTRALLVVAALVPAGALLLADRARERIEASIGRGFDRRRGMRRDIIKTAPRETEALLGYVIKSLGHMTGGSVRFASAESLPAGLAAELAAAPEPYLLRAARADLPGDLVVAVRGRGTLHGALVLAGGEIDRDVLLAALTLADNLALTLENRRLFGELEESRRLAALGQFAAAIAHDIRTPLTSVQLNVQMLRRKAQLSPDDMEHFDIALAELRRLEADVSQLLDFAKPVRLHAQPLDLREVIDEAARRMEPIYEEKRLQLRAEHGDVPPVLGDGERLRQVLTNLLDNAAQASAAGEIVIRTRTADGGRVALEVADPGEGIPPDELARIFEPFYTTRPDGTGLGLATCAKLVRAHGGEIHVRSAPGEGATFTVLLPAA